MNLDITHAVDLVNALQMNDRVRCHRPWTGFRRHCITCAHDQLPRPRPPPPPLPNPPRNGGALAAFGLCAVCELSPMIRESPVFTSPEITSVVEPSVMPSMTFRGSGFC